MKVSAAAGWAIVLLALIPARAAPHGDPANYLFLDADDAADHRAMLARPDIEGGQIIYPWRQLEPEKDQYDFSKLEADLAVAESLHKKLFIIIGDRTFSLQWRGMPDYLSTDPVYQGGIVYQYNYPGSAPDPKQVANGQVAMQWIPAVRQRFQKLIQALATRFDGHIAGIELGETAMDAHLKDGEKGFTCDGYFDAEMDNIAAARKAFHKTDVVLAANFWPCEWNDSRHYMSRAFAYAAANRIAVGGPDIMPFNQAQMKNAYPFLHDYRGKLKLVAMAVQEPTLEYVCPATGKPCTKEEFVSYGRDYLGVEIIFWAYIAPWLKEPPLDR